MTWLYLLAFVISVVILAVVIMKGRTQNIYWILMAVIVVNGTAGYLMIVTAHELETAIFANKLSYIANCFFPLVLFLMLAELCQWKISKEMVVCLTGYSLIIMICVMSVGYNNVYYTNVELGFYHGVGYLIRTYGLAHAMYLVMLCGYLIAIFAEVVYAFFHSTKVSFRTVAILGMTWILTTLLYGGQKACEIRLEILPFLYVVDLFVFLLMSNRMNLYAMTVDEEGDEEESREECGRLVFDSRRNYMGGNLFAQQLFPELKKLRIDSPVTWTENELLDTLVGWLERYAQGTEADTQEFEASDRILRFTIKILWSGQFGIRKGYRIEFIDVTTERNYVQMIEQYSDDLKREVFVKTRDISRMKDKLVLGMACMVESRDNSTGGHIKRTSTVVRIFSRRLLEEPEEFGITEKFLDNVVKAAPMHDLGKIAVDDRVLRKQGKYTEQEYEEMKIHTVEGARIVDTILTDVEDPYFVEIAINVAHYHHEKWDGSGYPEGLHSDQIPLEARIMALADVFDALVSKRCYKEAMSYTEAFNIIEDSLGTHFDPDLGEAFLDCREDLEDFYDTEAKGL
ncbi:MAG: HD domain-containing phosphohydrolase [Lachnospiraceae bacterium]